MNKLFPIIFSLLFLMPCYIMGHEKSQMIKNVRGEYATAPNSNVTRAEAEEKARENAKRIALERAFGTQVNIWDKIEVSSAGESFNSLSIIQISGEIEEFNIVEEGVEKHPVHSSELIYYCIANVKVRRGVDPDPNFTAAIDNIHAHYRSGELCQMAVQPTQRAYLKIFLFENSEVGYYLYPGGSHHGILIEADRTAIIPRTIDQDIQLYTNKKRETNTIVVLLTKEEYPFNVLNPTRADIDKFIARIPNNMKYVSYHMVEISK